MGSGWVVSECGGVRNVILLATSPTHTHCDLWVGVGVNVWAWASLRGWVWACVDVWVGGGSVHVGGWVLAVAHYIC